MRKMKSNKSLLLLAACLLACLVRDTEGVSSQVNARGYTLPTLPGISSVWKTQPEFALGPYETIVSSVAEFTSQTIADLRVLYEETLAQDYSSQVECQSRYQRQFQLVRELEHKFRTDAVIEDFSDYDFFQNFWKAEELDEASSDLKNLRKVTNVKEATATARLMRGHWRLFDGHSVNPLNKSENRPKGLWQDRVLKVPQSWQQVRPQKGLLLRSHSFTGGFLYTAFGIPQQPSCFGQLFLYRNAQNFYSSSVCVAVDHMRVSLAVTRDGRQFSLGARRVPVVGRNVQKIEMGCIFDALSVSLFVNGEQLLRGARYDQQQSSSGGSGSSVGVFHGAAPDSDAKQGVPLHVMSFIAGQLSSLSLAPPRAFSNLERRDAHKDAVVSWTDPNTRVLPTKLEISLTATDVKDHFPGYEGLNFFKDSFGLSHRAVTGGFAGNLGAKQKDNMFRMLREPDFLIHRSIDNPAVELIVQLTMHDTGVVTGVLFGANSLNVPFYAIVVFPQTSSMQLLKMSFSSTTVPTVLAQADHAAILDAVGMKATLRVKFDGPNGLIQASFGSADTLLEYKNVIYPAFYTAKAGLLAAGAVSFHHFTANPLPINV